MQTASINQQRAIGEKGKTRKANQPNPVKNANANETECKPRKHKNIPVSLQAMVI